MSIGSSSTDSTGKRRGDRSQRQRRNDLFEPALPDVEGHCSNEVFLRSLFSACIVVENSQQPMPAEVELMDEMMSPSRCASIRIHRAVQNCARVTISQASVPAARAESLPLAAAKRFSSEAGLPGGNFAATAAEITASFSTPSGLYSNAKETSFR